MDVNIDIELNATAVVARTQFEGWHRWKDAPDRFAYLSYSHRHVFHVEVIVYVTDPNRGIEFIDLKHRVNDILSNHLHSSAEEPMEYSCEQMATIIGFEVNRQWGHRVGIVKVFEDGENGGLAFFVPKEEKVEQSC